MPRLLANKIFKKPQITLHYKSFAGMNKLSAFFISLRLELVLDI